MIVGSRVGVGLGSEVGIDVGSAKVGTAVAVADETAIFVGKTSADSCGVVQAMVRLISARTSGVYIVRCVIGGV